MYANSIRLEFYSSQSTKVFIFKSTLWVKKKVEVFHTDFFKRLKMLIEFELQFVLNQV